MHICVLYPDFINASTIIFVDCQLTRVASQEFPGKWHFSREWNPGKQPRDSRENFILLKSDFSRSMNHINTFFTSSSLNIKLLHDHNFLFCIDVARNTFLDHGQRSGQGQSRNGAIMVILSTAPQCLCCYGPCGLIWSFDFPPQKYGKGSAVTLYLSC